MAANSRFAVSPHLLAYLAFQAGRPVPSAEIASRVGTSPVVIRRLLATLVQGGVVRARKGAAGDFAPARPADEIPPLAIYRVVEPRPDQGLAHLDPNPGRPVGSRIGSLLRGIFAAAQAGMERELGRMTRADLRRELPPVCNSTKHP